MIKIGVSKSGDKISKAYKISNVHLNGRHNIIVSSVMNVMYNVKPSVLSNIKRVDCVQILKTCGVNG